MMEWMIDTIWASSLLILFVLILRRPVAHYFGPSIAYTLWLIPAARLFMPAIYKEVEVGTMQTTLPTQGVTSFEHIIGAPINNAAVPNINWLAIMMVIWCGTAVAIFIIQTMRYIAMRDEMLANADTLGQYDNITLIQSDMVSSPLAFGIFKKYIAVPLDFESMFPREERKLAILHEMAHHKSGDLIINTLAFAFLCLTWFSPLSWFAWNKFRIDQESACDARVLRGAENGSAHIYGRALLRSTHSDGPIFLAALNSPKTIITRLKRLKMSSISYKRQMFGKLSIFSVIAAALPMTATIVPVAAQEKERVSLSKSNHKMQVKKEGQFIANHAHEKSLTPATAATITVKGDNIINDAVSKNHKNISINIGTNGEKTEDKDRDVINIKNPQIKLDKNINLLTADIKKSLRKIELKFTHDHKSPKDAKVTIRKHKNGSIEISNTVDDETAYHLSHHPFQSYCKSTYNSQGVLAVCNTIKTNQTIHNNLQKLNKIQSRIHQSVLKTLKETDIAKKDQRKIIRKIEMSIGKRHKNGASCIKDMKIPSSHDA